MYVNGVDYIQKFVKVIPSFLKSQNQEIYDVPLVLFSCILLKLLFRTAYEFEMSNRAPVSSSNKWYQTLIWYLWTFSRDCTFFSPGQGLWVRFSLWVRIYESFICGLRFSASVRKLQQDYPYSKNFYQISRNKFVNPERETEFP